VVSALVTAVTALALISALVTVLTSGAGRTAVRVLLDLLTAAGLLRLAGGLGWTDLASAAAIVALRQLLGVALGTAPPWSRRQSPPPCAENDRPLPLAVRGKTGESGRIST
jgi:hypothetical protein